MAHRALVYKSASAQNLTDGRWSLTVHALFTDTDALVPAEDQQVNVEIDPALPGTWATAIDAAVMAKGTEHGFTLSSGDIFTPVFA